MTAPAPAGDGTAAPGRLSRELLSFGLIGLAGLFVDMAALWVAMSLLGLGQYGGRAFSYLVAATFTWWMNRTFTFRGVSRRGALRQWATFLAANALGFLANYATYVAVLHWGPPIADWLFGAWWPLDGWAWPYLGVAAGSGVGMVFNFAASKMLVFRKR